MYYNFRYANLFFCILVDSDDNELLSLEIIQRYVEVLDQYFGSVWPSTLLSTTALQIFTFRLILIAIIHFCCIIKVCELDIIFNFEKAHFVWNELVLAGELLETSRRAVLESVLDQDDIQRVKYFVFIEIKLISYFAKLFLFKLFIIINKKDEAEKSNTGDSKWWICMHFCLICLFFCRFGCLFFCTIVICIKSVTITLYLFANIISQLQIK